MLNDSKTLVAQDTVLFSGTMRFVSIPCFQTHQPFTFPRENIDPFGDYTNEECMDALSHVHLLSDSKHTSQRSSGVTSQVSLIHNVEREETPASSSIASPTATQHDNKQGIITLDTQVSIGGDNFSQGQHQLLTMA